MTQKTFAILCALTLICGVLSACNTMAGAGQDMKAAGQAVTNSAERNGASK
jgi:predicted small secreted protein